jgi:hypothetical protein
MGTRAVLERYSSGTRAVLERYSSGTRAVLERYSRGTRAVLEEHAADLQSATVRTRAPAVDSRCCSCTSLSAPIGTKSESTIACAVAREYPRSTLKSAVAVRSEHTIACTHSEAKRIATHTYRRFSDVGKDRRHCRQPDDAAKELNDQIAADACQRPGWVRIMGANNRTH